MKPEQKFIVTYGGAQEQEEMVMNWINSGWRVVSVTPRAVTGHASGTTSNGGFGILLEKDRY
jgi:hypothetical protein